MQLLAIAVIPSRTDSSLAASASSPKRVMYLRAPISGASSPSSLSLGTAGTERSSYPSLARRSRSPSLASKPRGLVRVAIAKASRHCEALSSRLRSSSERAIFHFARSVARVAARSRSSRVRLKMRSLLAAAICAAGRSSGRSHRSSSCIWPLASSDACILSSRIMGCSSVTMAASAVGNDVARSFLFVPRRRRFSAARRSALRTSTFSSQRSRLFFPLQALWWCLMASEMDVARFGEAFDDERKRLEMTMACTLVGSENRAGARCRACADRR